MKHPGNKKVTILIIFNEQNETFSKRKKNTIQRIKLIRVMPEHKCSVKEYWTWSSFTTVILFYISLLTIRQ